MSTQDYLLLAHIQSASYTGTPKPPKAWPYVAAIVAAVIAIISF